MFFYIIVPIYNSYKYLTKCLDSLFNQTYRNYLVICVNDGSTDDSLSILNIYKSKYKNRIVIINKPNGGVSSARNAGLDYIKDYNNSYITFVDSDDWVRIDYLEKAYEIIHEQKCDILHLPYYDAYDDKNVLVNNNVEGTFNNSEAINLMLEDTLHCIVCSSFFSSKLFIDCRFPLNIPIGEDTYMAFMTHSLTAKNIYVCNYAGYFYNHLSTNYDSATKSAFSFDKKISSLIVYQLLFTRVKDLQSNVLFRQKIAKLYWHNIFRFDYDYMSFDEKKRFRDYMTWFDSLKLYKNFSKKKHKYAYLLYLRKRINSKIS